MPKAGVRLYRDTYSTFLRETPTWRLNIEREATEADLEANHILEEIGETIWTTSLEVSHCPFCGAPLYEATDELPKDFGRFAHLDSSGWESRRL